jgi:hypothetical protein
MRFCRSKGAVSAQITNAIGKSAIELVARNAQKSAE